MNRLNNFYSKILFKTEFLLNKWIFSLKVLKVYTKIESKHLLCILMSIKTRFRISFLLEKKLIKFCKHFSTWMFSTQVIWLTLVGINITKLLINLDFWGKVKFNQHFPINLQDNKANAIINIDKVTNLIIIMTKVLLEFLPPILVS